MALITPTISAHTDSANGSRSSLKNYQHAFIIMMQNNPARMAHIVDFSQYSTDLANHAVPDYTWISPDQCNDMHGRGGGGSSDPCDFSHVQGLIATGDAFLKNTVGAIMNSNTWTGN